MASLGIVVSLKGQAFVVDEKSNKKPLHLGDVVQPGDIINTLSGGIVDLQLANGRHIQIVAEQTVKLSQELADIMPPNSADSSVDQASIQAIMKAVEEGKDISDALDAPAAGLAANSPSYGFSFVNLLRIAESVTPINFSYDFARDTPVDVVLPSVIINPTVIGAATLIDTATVTLDKVTGDNIINNIEAKAETTIISGTVGGNVVAGDIVTLTIGTHTVLATVAADLTFNTSTQVQTAWLIDSSQINASVTDKAGSTATTTEIVHIDTLTATVTLDEVTGDNIINNIEANAETTTISGKATTTGGIVTAGQTVTLMIGTHTVNGVVVDPTTHTFSADVPTSWIIGSPIITASFTVTDVAGSIASDLTDTVLTLESVNIRIPQLPQIDGINAIVYEHGLVATDNSQQTTGSFTVSSNDGISSVSVAGILFTLAELTDPGYLSSHPISVADGVLTITGYSGSATNGTVSYHYELSHTITNPTAASTFVDDSLTVSVLGVGGSTDSRNLVIRIMDDTPSLTINADLPSLIVHESNLTSATNSGVDGSSPNLALTTVRKDFSSAFTVSTGADGGTTSYALSIGSLTPVDSKIIDIATGQHVMLNSNGNVVTGYVTVGGNHLNVFTVDLDAATCKVTLTDYRAVHQGSTTNDVLSLTNLVTLTATVTDGDGDKKSASINLGAQLSIEDDGPNLTVNADLPSLIVHESNLTSATNSGVDGSSPNLALTTVSKDFSSAFAVSTGADGGTISYALSIGSLTPVDSKIIDIATNQHVMLATNGNLVTGYVTVGGTHINVFSVDVDAATGKVALTDYRAVHEDSTTNDALSLTNLVTLTATVTDGDGDIKSASINLGAQLSIVDDSPSSLIANHVYEVNSLDSGNNLHQTGLYKIDAGADGAKSFEFDHSLQTVLAYDNNTSIPLSFGGLQLHLYFLDVAGVTDYTKLVASTAQTVENVTQSNTGYSIDINLDGTYNVHDYGVISNTVSNSPIELSYKIIGTDGDGDKVIGHLDTTFTPYDSTILGSGAINGVGSNDLYLLGTDSNDTITGNNGNDLLVGGGGNDTLNAGNGNDTLIGGSGNDILNGNIGVDVFKWELADRGTVGLPGADIVQSFSLDSKSAGGDVLDLKDLLFGEHDGLGSVASNLTSYLHFDNTTTANATTISVSSIGGFIGGSFNSEHVDQIITLTHVDLVGAHTQEQIIADMLANQKLITDH
jgi:hypothetical protein